jgi:hypothetical protein
MKLLNPPVTIIWLLHTRLELPIVRTVGFLSLSANERFAEGLSLGGGKGGSDGVEVFAAGDGAW